MKIKRLAPTCVQLTWQAGRADGLSRWTWFCPQHGVFSQVYVGDGLARKAAESGARKHIAEAHPEAHPEVTPC